MFQCPKLWVTSFIIVIMQSYRFYAIIYATTFRSIDIWALTREIVSEYDQEIPQSQTADYPVAPRGRAAQPSRDTRKTN